MTPAYRPTNPERLVGELADRFAAEPSPGAALRVAIDGAPPARPVELAEALVALLRERGRSATVVRADFFWRDASLRLEHGREDVDEYLVWLDAAALQREVLDPLGPQGSGRFIASLRDPSTNRATRAEPQLAVPGAIVVVAGSLLLGRGLTFDGTVHLALSHAALQRRTPAGEQWTLPAFGRYSAETRPEDVADVVARLDDPRRPALRS